MEGELIRANDHITFLTGLTGENIKQFGKELNDHFTDEESPHRPDKKMKDFSPLQDLNTDAEPARPLLSRDEETEEDKKDSGPHLGVSTKELSKNNLPDVTFNSKVKQIMNMFSQLVEDWRKQ